MNQEVSWLEWVRKSDLPKGSNATFELNFARWITIRTKVGFACYKEES
jgi:hypothetical protein